MPIVRHRTVRRGKVPEVIRSAVPSAAGIGLGRFRATITLALLLLPGVACRQAGGAGDKATMHRKALPLLFEYAIEDSGGGPSRPGMPGDTCRTGDAVRLSISTGEDCMLMVFGIDSMMIPQPVFPDAFLVPRFFSAGTMSLPLYLYGDIAGTEFYYAVASRRNFTFKDIVPYLDTTLSRIEAAVLSGEAETPALSDVSLRLPPGKFSTGCIWFRHLPRPADSAAVVK
jgi:hypothetical protein